MVSSAEILQINNSSNILVGDQNRDLSIKLFCVDINETKEMSELLIAKDLTKETCQN